MMSKINLDLLKLLVKANFGSVMSLILENMLRAILFCDASKEWGLIR